MKLYYGAIVVLLTGVCLAGPTTHPATDVDEPLPAPTPTPLPQPAPAPAPKPAPVPSPVPAPKPAPKPSPAPGPAPAPRIKPAPAAKDQALPTPGDLIRKMKEMQAEKAKATKVAYLDLSMPIAEKPADFSLFGEEGAVTLRSLIDRIHQARDDKDIRAVLITLGEHGMALSQATEVRDALAQLRTRGKRTFIYADAYDTVGYTLASGATDICMLEGGELMIPGIGLEATFYKGLFDKLGVKADYVQIGEYKGADEEYTRTGPSDELKGELSKLTGSLYEQIIDGISFQRNLPRQAVVQMVDDTILNGRAARDRGFVDHLLDQDDLRALLSKELGNNVDLLHDYGAAPRPTVDFSSPLAFLQMLNRQPPPSDKPQVAIIYADGVITDGEAQGGLFSESGVGSASMRRALRIAARDEKVKAVVIRIDSPGGSALASEVMWQAARHVAEKKPLIISVGSMAASGGYYLASAGDRIFADATSIVGSIGVVGGKFVIHDLYEKLGLKTESFSRGANAGLYSSDAPFTERQRKMVTNSMRQTYDQFTQRVMTTRAGKIKDIDQVARGRIFTARQAVNLGMVDQIGGIDDAIAYAAKEADLGEGKYDVRLLPAPRTLADLLGMGAGAQALSSFSPKVQINPDSILQALPAGPRQMLLRQLQTLQLLQSHPVALVSPFMMTLN